MYNKIGAYGGVHMELVAFIKVVISLMVSEAIIASPFVAFGIALGLVIWLVRKGLAFVGRRLFRKVRRHDR